MNQILESGEVTRGELGVWIQDLTPQLADQFGLKDRSGALVSNVIEDSPAEKAGIEQGDVIVSVDGVSVDDPNQLKNLIAGLKPGYKANLSVMRSGREKTITVSIGQKKTDKLVSMDAAGTDLGLTVQNMTPELASKFGHEEDSEGVLVASVDAGSSARKAGLIPGMLIVEVNQEPVKNTSDFSKALKKWNGEDGLLLLVEQKGMRQYLVLGKE
jgi:serine protease Do